AGLVAELDVVAREAGVRAHRPPLGGGDVPVAVHLVEHEAREPARLAVARPPAAVPVGRRDVDGRPRGQLRGSVLEQLGGDHRRPCLSSRRSLYSIESTRACHEASMMLSATPTVPQVSFPSPEVTSTRVFAAVPLDSSRIRTL